MTLPARLLVKLFLKLLVKPEFPQLYALASVWIATPLLGLCTIVYVQNALTQPAANMFPIGLSAFAGQENRDILNFLMSQVVGPGGREDHRRRGALPRLDLEVSGN
jgi:hypothetical protein